ncbi:hypothetical protein D3C81_594130 [compost metagenome]
MTSGDTTAFLNVDLAVGFDIKRSSLTTQTLWNQLHLQLVITDLENYFRKEQVKDLLSGVVQCTQNDGRRQFTATVNTYKQVVFRVKLEIQP